MKGFPAATGIGNNTQNITLEICAIQADDTLIDVAIENPKQLNPYQYGQEVLAGDPIPSQEVKHPPEFERAKLVITPYISRVFISGTASITGQLTIGIGDIEKQTKCTLENIGLLIADETLRKSYPGIPSGKLNFSFLRIYVKYARDVEKVREICEQYYPSVIKTYTVTDVCRDDLLVEIEGELFLDPRKADN
jgi:enamine deaminase RidA (YjgF/YER057c/UK114 family)